MSEVDQVLTDLRDEFNRWEGLLANLNETQITTSDLPGGLSIKDTIAHLMAWQQVSNARLEAALRDVEPILPAWLAGSDPESEHEIDRFNARIFEIYRRQSWAQVHHAWQDGFLKLIRISNQIPQTNLLEVDKYPWLKGYPLVAVLHGTYEHHHHDHLEPLMDWLNQQSQLQGN
jgi:hypothetical protein